MRFTVFVLNGYEILRPGLAELINVQNDMEVVVEYTTMQPYGLSALVAAVF